MANNYRNDNQTDYQNIEKTMGRIFLNTIFNWEQIRENSSVMQVLNMETNSMCRHMKMSNPSMRDQFIQAYVLSFLLILFLIMCVPAQNLVDGSARTFSEMMTPSEQTDQSYVTFTQMQNPDVD
ncbi:hypothetical protein YASMINEVIRUS_315 [Yasminevirus sp. GU-2018]|uniref:Uncharacterized protein n=1 Tax=Yasminevirus sp. GU-2018 TaxID=2420051 RepID=A0A5K0U8X0_9VIRU|nr:hypothetical protein YASMINEVIRUS_315 [Yasminevirus sp. GU-2018]